MEERGGGVLVGWLFVWHCIAWRLGGRFQFDFRSQDHDTFSDDVLPTKNIFL
jgi:hypothetical protein